MMDRLYFILVLALTWPVRFLPFKAIHGVGRVLGSCLYVCVPKFRKRCLSNLSLASALKLSPQEIRAVARASLQNLVITCLEYAKFASLHSMEGVARCENPEEAQALMDGGKPVIFFCGHLSNWEVLFLEGTRRMKGVAIGRPIQNALLYRWVVSIREKFGGKIIAPKQAIREGLRGLKQGCFLGIVGDQGMPDSGFSSLFLGRRAWSSPMPAILAHRTGCPLIVATTRREAGGYVIRYSEPMWPNPEAPMQQEVERLMGSALGHLEAAIRAHPGEWLWSHNRWKQQTPGRLKKPFRHESILIILPKTPIELGAFREIYPHEFITVYAPAGQPVDLEGAEVIFYEELNELPREDLRFKLVFNFTPFKAHFKAAFTVVGLGALKGGGSFRDKLRTLVLHAP